MVSLSSSLSSDFFFVVFRVSRCALLSNHSPPPPIYFHPVTDLQ